MSDKQPPSATPTPVPRPESEPYLVVARRYRPQSFAELVGQPLVSGPLSNAILQNRIGHAYLFSGARGTGKTSTARILAKCLNCHSGPTLQPCQTCDVCQGITAGEDIDVLEIDGASNRRIEEIRQLRSTVNIRPSRARFKIYIIDEVHMLTKEAFNALLKTLEEPPEHVKFIFCTTELDKIPTTIRSRCQLFEFVPVEENAIRERLRQIAAQEHVAISEDALLLLARRAAGSLRDSQSLLEQMLALGLPRVELDDVNRALGIADSRLIEQLAGHLTGRQSAEALSLVHRALSQGVDPGQLAGQLLGIFRDCFVAGVGGGDDLLVHISPDQTAAVRETARRIGPENALAIAQIFDECISRMRTSVHPRILLEIAIVRACRLDDLQSLSDLIEQLGTTPAAGRSPAASVPRPTPIAAPAPVSSPAHSSSAEPARAKKNEVAEADDTVDRLETPVPPVQDVATSAGSLSTTDAEAVWREVLSRLADATAEIAAQFHHVEWSPFGRLLVSLGESQLRFCNRPEPKSRVERVLEQVIGQPAKVEFRAAAVRHDPPAPAASPASKLKQMRESVRDPLVQAAMQLFDAVVVDTAGPKAGSEPRGGAMVTANYAPPDERA